MSRAGARRRALLGIALALLLSVAVLSAGEDAAGTVPEERPNILVVMTDDENPSDLRVMDNTQRELVAQGTSFENFFSTFPLCCPSRASFLTGQYSHNHGVTRNRPPGGGYPGFDDTGDLAIALHAGGYETAWIGKYLNAFGKGEDGSHVVPSGWDDWVAPTRREHEMYRYILDENGRVRRYGRRPRQYQTDVYSRLAASAIQHDAQRSKPFFTVLSMLAPHGEPRGRVGPVNPRPAPRDRGRFDHAPLPTPPSFDESDMSDKPSFLQRPPIDPQKRRWIRERYRARLASLLAADDAVGRVFDVLRRTGQLDNTYVIFWSDNGFMLGEHRRVGKVWLYEEAVKVPMIIRGPGIPQGATRTQIAGNIDLAPTILDLAGVAPMRPPDGVSLLPFVADPAYDANRDILLENHQDQGVRTPRYAYIEHFRGADATVPNGYELYDLENDPYELENLIGPDNAEPRTDHPDRRAQITELQKQLAARLDALRDCQAEECQAQ